jgi:hypothetical protein
MARPAARRTAPLNEANAAGLETGNRVRALWIAMAQVIWTTRRRTDRQSIDDDAQTYPSLIA